MSLMVSFEERIPSSSESSPSPKVMVTLTVVVLRISGIIGGSYNNSHHPFDLSASAKVATPARRSGFRLNTSTFVTSILPAP